MAWYLALVDDFETVACFFDFHDMGESPIKMKHLEVECLVSRHATQSESQNALICRGDEAG